MSSVRVFAGTCPDESCRRRMVFSSSETLADCLYCGQRHHTSAIHDATEIKDQAMAVQTVVRSLLTATHPSLKRGVETVKVQGLSNYHCKLLSPLFTTNGMDKNTFTAKPLSELTHKATFDCGKLSDRSFRIDPQHLEVPGYGRDMSGSVTYLAGTLARINGTRETLVPIHADGDGHCLVHAVSRALIGRELFWHPLRTNLKQHFIQNLDKYKALFQDFINASEWRGIIEECDPEYEPLEDDAEIHGLRNIHVFGLANVLKRPIILLDSVAGMNSSGDYSAVFLPALLNPEECRGRSGELNKPICLAWSSSAHNHYIPLVGIKGENLPLIPRGMLPKVWAVPQSLLTAYIEFDTWDCVTVGGERSVQENYLKKLTEAMNELFLQTYGVHPALVSDVHQYNYRKPSGVTVKPKLVVQTTQRAVQERRLFRCLTCDACCIALLSTEWLRPGNNGILYNMAVKRFGQLRTNQKYSFNTYGVTCSYDAKKDVLVLDKNVPPLDSCSVCHDNKLRLVLADGTVVYENGDPTKTPASLNGRCRCGYKHWWAGKEYDNMPEMVPVILRWGDRVITETVPWFQYESDPNLNSNAFQVASYLVQKHFPGEFGSEHLIQTVVNHILEMTKRLQTTHTAMEDKIKKDRAPVKEERTRCNKFLGSPGSPDNDLCISPETSKYMPKQTPVSQACKLGATPRENPVSHSDGTSSIEVQKMETVSPQKVQPLSPVLSPAKVIMEADNSSQPQPSPACSAESGGVSNSDLCSLDSQNHSIPLAANTEICEELNTELCALKQQQSEKGGLLQTGKLYATASNEQDSHKKEVPWVCEGTPVSGAPEKQQEQVSSEHKEWQLLENPKEAAATNREVVPKLLTLAEENAFIHSEENEHIEDSAVESPVAIQRRSKKMAAMCKKSPVPWAVVTTKPCTGTLATAMRVGPGYSILRTEGEDKVQKSGTSGELQDTNRKLLNKPHK